MQNYALTSSSGEANEFLKCLEEQRTIEQYMAYDDDFQPWIPTTSSQINLKLGQLPKITTKLPTPLTEQIYNEDMVDEVKEDVDIETITAFNGSITHTFVNVGNLHYTQEQVQSFAQIHLQTLLTQKENLKLKLYFNKDFENNMQIKIREMNNVKERNARLKHIISEYDYFSVNKLGIDVVEPEWKQEETPEKLIKVENYEVGVLPYISPSEQAILDAQAAEAERLRLLMLADDFKERALYAMMWGVLEIRWEDELRKEVPIPKCMIEKEPENFNEDDLRAIRDYEEKVKFLNSERERYKVILEGEYVKLGAQQREAVKKFNSRLSELLILKIKIDTAIGQENLKIHRYRYNGLKRIIQDVNENQIETDIRNNEKQIESTIKLIVSTQECISEIKAYIETLLVKEKTLEKNFKKEFADVNPIAHELIQKIYKKRPKTNVKGITSIALLIELSRCLVAHERTLILNAECIEFLKAMDSLDSYVGVANLVDEHTYINVCKHRRLKIESEIKTKAGYLELSESEATLSTLNKKLVNLKELNNKYNANLTNLRSTKIKEAHNIEVQLVLKQGFIEVPTSGKITDFDEAVMVSRSDVAEINRLIVKVGNKKLKAMREAMNFRREILTTEWEHQRMKMKIKDHLERVKDIQTVKVTKEVQSYLKMKAKGRQGKELTFEQEVELIQKSYERMINDRKQSVAELQEKIAGIRKEIKKLNRKIKDINVDVCEFKLNVDETLEQREKNLIRLRMATLLKRAKLVKEIQENHNEILVLQTELELLRLKTYPTLKFKVVT